MLAWKNAGLLLAVIRLSYPRALIRAMDEATSRNSEQQAAAREALKIVKAEEGDVVELRTPNGARRIEVVRIAYGER